MLNIEESQSDKLVRIEQEMLQDPRDGERPEIDVTTSNLVTRQLFASCFKLPEWSNPFCYWYKMPDRTNEMTNWAEIGTAFCLTDSQRLNLQLIENQTDHRGWLPYTRLKMKDKARIIGQLSSKQAVKIVLINGMGMIILNPSIVYGRSWWSPYMQGVMLVNWMNESLYWPELSVITDSVRHYQTQCGCEAVINASCEGL